MKKCFFVINILLFFVISVNAEISSTVLDFSEEENIVKNYIELLSYTDEELEKIIGADLTVRGVTKENKEQTSLFLSSKVRNLHFTTCTQNEMYNIIGQFFVVLGAPDDILEEKNYSEIKYIREIGVYDWAIQVRILFSLEDFNYIIAITSSKVINP